MGEWQEYVLEDVIEIFIDYRGKTPKKSESGIPLVTAKIVKSGRILEPNEFIAVEDYDSWMRRGLPEIDDIVLTTEAPLGEIALIKDSNVALAQRIITLRGKHHLVYNPFLKYYFQSRNGQYELQSRASGTTVFGIKATVLKKVPVILPPLPEQKAIASVLSSLDDKIDLLHRQNKTLEAMAETLFRQWFVEEAHEDWEEGCLGDISDNIRNSVNHVGIPLGTVYVGLEHIDRKSIPLNKFGHSDNLQSNKYRFQENDILFGKLRPYFHKITFAPFSGVCSTDILVIRAKNQKLFNFCLFAFYQADVVEYANLGSEGTRMPRTNWNTLKQYSILIPDESLLDKYNQIVTPSITKIKQNQTQIQTLEKLRDTLLPKLMNGEVRVEYEN